MSKTNHNSKTSENICFNKDSSDVARLRRLKIQEGILVSNVNKTSNELDTNDDNNKYKFNKEFKKYLNKLRDSYLEINILYEDIKVKTNIPETLVVNDFNDLKRDIVKFEEEMKSFKYFLRTELTLLQTQEAVLIDKNNEDVLQQNKYIGSTKPKKIYNIYVTSPVRALINSPFKCLEIQQFQEFMKSSPDRYGGWNEYNHNVFVQIWDMYNGNEYLTIKPIKNAQLLQEFKDEVLEKISGTKREDVNTHCEWYSQYIYLKNCQKEAIDKWKENKRKIKKPLGFNKTLRKENCMAHEHIGSLSGRASRSNLNNPSKINSENIKRSECNIVDLPRKVDVTRLMRPTTQSENRCGRSEDISSMSFVYNIETIQKLQVPNWRRFDCTKK